MGPSHCRVENLEELHRQPQRARQDSRSAIYDIADNHPHVQKAMMVPDDGEPTADKQEKKTT